MKCLKMLGGQKCVKGKKDNYIYPSLRSQTTPSRAEIPDQVRYDKEGTYRNAITTDGRKYTPSAVDPRYARMTAYGIPTCSNNTAGTKIHAPANYNIDRDTYNEILRSTLRMTIHHADTAAAIVQTWHATSLLPLPTCTITTAGTTCYGSSTTNTRRSRVKPGDDGGEAFLYAIPAAGTKIGTPVQTWHATSLLPLPTCTITTAGTTRYGSSTTNTRRSRVKPGDDGGEAFLYAIPAAGTKIGTPVQTGRAPSPATSLLSPAQATLPQCTITAPGTKLYARANYYIPLGNEMISLKKEIISLKREIIPFEREMIPLKRRIIPLRRENVPLKREILSLKREIIPFKRENKHYPKLLTQLLNKLLNI